MKFNWVSVYISIGSNLGAREQNLVNGVLGIERLPETKLTGLSALYRTDPWGYLEQAEFLNAVVRVTTKLEPRELLAGLQAIENDMGRKRVVHWGPRIIDLDIVLYGNTQINLPELQVPHPRMHERAFVLVPLAELEPGLIVAGKSLEELIKGLKEQKIYLFKQKWFDRL